MRIAPDGEILVGATTVRYLGQAPCTDSVLATGDLGHLDPDGFLYVNGRKKDVLITGFGRNVSPEWLESALTGTGVIAQAMVVGEAQAHLATLIVPARAGLDEATLAATVARANATLPDYARVQRWVAVAPFTPANGLVTADGRPRRALIQAHLATQIAALFDPQESLP